MGLVASISAAIRGTPAHKAARWLYRSVFQRSDLRQRRRIMRLYALFVSPGDLCFDVGANYGSRTDALLALGARVVAVEPQPGIADALRRRFEGVRRFTVVQRALGAAEGQALMYVCNMHLLTTLSREWVDGCKLAPHLRHAEWREMPVPVTTLDALIREHGRPAFVKLDVEGFEAEILRGLSAPVPALSFEMTPRLPHLALNCLGQISRLGPAEFNVARGEAMALAFDRWMAPAEIEAFCRDQLPREPTYGDIYVRFT